MATAPGSYLFGTCLLLLTNSFLVCSENESASEDIDSDIAATVSVAAESGYFENVTTEAPSAVDSAVGGENATKNAAIVAGIRSALSSLGMEISLGGSGVTARVKMSKFFHPLLLVPGLIVWGFAPVIIAKLKWFVWQALMLNHMALMSAWYMTLRNIVFGPRPGNAVKYANYGYGPNRFHHYHRH